VAFTHRQHRLGSHRRARQYLRPALGAAIAGTTILLGGATVYAAAVVHGRADLVVPQTRTAGLEVTGVRLSALTPGAAADLSFTVRNPGAVFVTTDRVTALLPLRDARPARCTEKVSGPLLTRNGLHLAGQQRRTLAPGDSEQITVPAALRLSSTVRTGCGFTATLDVRAVQLSAGPTPPAQPTMPAAIPPTPTATASTTPTPSAETALLPKPTEAVSPPEGGLCDPLADPDC
jgi:hypothetical protein